MHLLRDTKVLNVEAVIYHPYDDNAVRPFITLCRDTFERRLPQSTCHSSPPVNEVLDLDGRA